MLLSEYIYNVPPFSFKYLFFLISDMKFYYAKSNFQNFLIDLLYDFLKEKKNQLQTDILIKKKPQKRYVCVLSHFILFGSFLFRKNKYKKR